MQLKEGQRWQYRARPGEEASTLVILKLETVEKYGELAHIALDRLKIDAPHHPEERIESVGHLPFEQSAIEKSVTLLLEENAELPDFEDGYRLWRKAFEAGEAGVYNLSVAESVASLESAMQNPARTGIGAEIMEELEREGSNLSESHTIDFFLYFPTESGAMQAANRLRKLNFRLEVRPPEQGSDWECIATIDAPPHEPTLDQIGGVCIMIAQECGGEFDGWEAHLVS